MQLIQLTPEDVIATERGQAVVCVPLYGGHEHFVRCLTSLLVHTPDSVPILICDDASPDPRSQELVQSLAESSDDDGHTVHYLRRQENLGFPANMNGAFAMTAPGDVVIVNSDCVVADGWLDGLRAAAYSDSRVATATTLTNHGSIVSVPERGRPKPSLPPDWTIEEAAAAVRRASLRIRPRLPTAIGHCLYVRRSALELVGDFDLAFSPGYGEEVDFSQRCLQSGLSHVLADDVLVLHHGAASFSTDGRLHPVKEKHERVIAARYPYYHDAIRDLERDASGALPRALSVARRVLSGTSVVIDGRILAGPMTGTQLQVLEVISALARTGRLHITVVVADQASDYAQRTLAQLDDVRLVAESAVRAEGLARADLVHRPHQIGNDEDLAFLAPLGERLVVTNQDLISFHNPAYFTSSGKWRGYRRVTRSALAVADRVVFISEHARSDALAEDLIEPSRASVVPNGVDHTLAGLDDDPVMPRGAARLAELDCQAILCLGTDFRHKNRLFALRLLAALRTDHDWDGCVVLAGPHVAQGSSAGDEARWLALHPQLRQATLELAAVSEAEKKWLYQRAALVLYPTVHEGFGLVPFEAADHDRPCLWAPATSLGEVLPAEAGLIVEWNPADTATRALQLMRDEAARRRNIDAVRAAARELTWDRVAERLLEIYEETCNAPATPASAVERREGVMQGTLSEDAMRLIGPDGALPVELERPLLAMATHPGLSAPMFGAIKLGYRAGFVWRRRLKREPNARRARAGG